MSKQPRHPLGLRVGKLAAVRDDDVPKLTTALERDPPRIIDRAVVQDHHRVDEPRGVANERLDDVLLVLHR